MAEAADILDIVRHLTRDFGTPFDLNFPAPVGSQLRLPHPMVEPSSVVVLSNTDGMPIDADTFAVNGHQGVLRLSDAASHTDGVTVQGVFYQWFLDEDLLFYIDMIVSEHLHNRGDGGTLSTIYGAEKEVLGIGALVLSLEALLFELSTDIDVVSPEGVNIPAHQRHNQVSQLINFWTNKYDEKAAMLNVGLKRIETFDLRRVSRTTERLVPTYRPREIDHHAPPIRVRPPIDPIADTGMDLESEAWIEAHGDEGDVGVIDAGDNFYGQGGW